MSRRVEKTVDIQADAATVWKALSEAEEIKRWFPLDARVTPGEGGEIWLSWGENAAWGSPIEVWKPGKQLRTVNEMPAGEGKEPVKIAVDYIIEGREGGTARLRLIHSGFADDTWDGEIESLDNGWAAFLANLKWYIERHLGQPREVAWYRHPSVPIPKSEAFGRTMRALGFGDGRWDGLQAGDRYAVTTAHGDSLRGVVKVIVAPGIFAATVENLGDGFLIAEMEPGRGSCRPAIWLSLYGEARARAGEYGPRVRGLLESAFAQGKEAPLAKPDGS